MDKISLKIKYPSSNIKLWTKNVSDETRTSDSVIKSGQYSGDILKGLLGGNGSRTATFWIEGLKPNACEIKFDVDPDGLGSGDPAEYVYNDLLKVCPIRIQKVKWATKDSPLNKNKNIGGGQRIFPCKISSNDTVDRRIVKIQAKIIPAIQDVPIYFKVFDVDDPSSSDPELDDESKDKDNFGAVVSDEILGPFSTDKNGLVETEYAVSMQPGDNFKGVASISKDYYEGIKAENVDGRTDSRILNKNSMPIPENISTEMLTVWRRCHVEMDTMRGKASDLNYKSGITIIVVPDPFNSDQSIVTVADTFDSDELDDPRGLTSRFENGVFRSWGGILFGTYDVVSNTKNTVIVKNNLWGPPPVDRKFKIFDDDKILRWLPDPDWSDLERAYKPAYIVPIMDLTFGHNKQPELHINYDAPTDSADEIIPYYQFDNVSNNLNNYWVIYLLGAYQYDYDEDGDPDNEARPYLPTQGIVDAIRGKGANIFIEVHNESCFNPNNREEEKDTVVHETGHLFGALERDEGIMGGIGSFPRNFSAKSLKKIRNTIKP